MLALGFNECFLNAEGCYVLGSPIRVVRPTSKGCMSGLADEIRDDGLMMEYRLPSMVQYSADTEYVDLQLDKKPPALVDGSRLGGIIAVSACYSFNGVFEDDVSIICQSSCSEQIINRINVIALGANNNRAVGIFVIPPIKGVYVRCGGKTYSSYNGIAKEPPSDGYIALTLADWFDGALLKEVV